MTEVPDYNKIAQDLLNITNWSIDSAYTKYKSEFVNNLSQNFHDLRKYILLKAIYYFPEPITHVLPLTQLYKQINVASYRSMNSILKTAGQYISEKIAKTFNGQIDTIDTFRTQFQNDQSKLMYFSHITFPTIYGFFTFGESCENAFNLIQNLLNKSHDDISLKICAGFFTGMSVYIEELANEFYRIARKYQVDKKLNDINVIEILLQAISYSTQYLTTYHQEIIKNLNETDQRFALRLIIDEIFYPAFLADYKNNIINKSTGAWPILKQILFVAREKPSGPTAQLIVKSIINGTTRTIPFSMYGNLTGLNMNYYIICCSVAEISMFVKLIDQDDLVKKFYDKVEQLPQDSINETRYIQIYSTPTNKQMFVPPTIFAKHNQVKVENNEDYLRKFLILEKISSKEITNGHELIQTAIRKQEILGDNKFEIYYNKMNINKSISRINIFEQALMYSHCNKELNNLIAMRADSYNNISQLMIANHYARIDGFDFARAISNNPAENSYQQKERLNLVVDMSRIFNENAHLMLDNEILQLAKYSLVCTHKENMLLFDEILTMMQGQIKQSGQIAHKENMVPFPSDVVPLLMTCYLYYSKYIKATAHRKAWIEFDSFMVTDVFSLNHDIYVKYNKYISKT